MRTLRTSIRRIGLLLAVAATGAISAAPARAQTLTRTDRAWIARLANGKPCTTLRDPIFEAPAMLRETRCILTRAALEEVRNGRAAVHGFPAADTARIASTSLYSATFRDLSGGPDASYWQITFAFRQRASRLTVHFDRQTQLITAGVAEGFGKR